MCLFHLRRLDIKLKTLMTTKVQSCYTSRLINSPLEVWLTWHWTDLWHDMVSVTSWFDKQIWTKTRLIISVTGDYLKTSSTYISIITEWMATGCMCCFVMNTSTLIAHPWKQTDVFLKPPQSLRKRLQRTLQYYTKSTGETDLNCPESVNILIY